MTRWQWLILSVVLFVGAWFTVSTCRHLWRDHTQLHVSFEPPTYTPMSSICTPVVTETDTTITFTGAKGCGPDVVLDKTAPLVTFDGNGRKLRLDASGLWVPDVVPPEATIFVKATGDHTDRGWVTYSASNIQIPLQGVGEKFDDIFDRVVSEAPGTPAITCGVLAPEGVVKGSVGDVYIRDIRGAGFAPCQVGP